jgi:hypothetical protein
MASGQPRERPDCSAFAALGTRMIGDGRRIRASPARGGRASGRGRAGNCAMDPFPPDEIKEEEIGDSIETGAAGRTGVSAGCRIRRARYSICVAGQRRSAARRRAPPGRQRSLQRLSFSEPPVQSQAGQKRARDRPRRSLSARKRGIGDHRKSRTDSNGASRCHRRSLAAGFGVETELRNRRLTSGGQKRFPN